MVKRVFGALPSKTDIRDYKYEPAAIQIFPDEFELPINNVKNQGSVGSCVAHSACEIAETFNLMQNKNNKIFSPGFIYGKRYEYKGTGMYLRDALKTLQKIGICEYEQFPYNKEVPEIIELFETNINKITGQEKNKISTYYQIDKNNENAIK